MAEDVWWGLSGRMSLATTRRAKIAMRVLAVVLAVGIFAFDTVSPLQFGVAVLYVIVVLITATCLGRACVVRAAAGCATLTILSFLLVHGVRSPDAAALRASMSLAAIAITTILAFKYHSTKERLGVTRRQRANLARFFSPQLADELAEMDTAASITRCQEAAVLFVDVVGFTAHSSDMEPEQIMALLRELLALLGDCVFSDLGTVDKFLGDGLMAVFGSRVPSSTDATNAARCALRMIASIDRWNDRRRERNEPAIRIAIGLHYGRIVQGNVGGESRLEFTAVGEVVNIASRLEAHCRTLNSALLVTAPLIVRLRAEGSDGLAETFMDFGCHVLRGCSEPMRLYGIAHPVQSRGMAVNSRAAQT